MIIVTKIGGIKMKAILTVIGKDKVGIIAAISNKLSKLKINILDVNQTILDGYFTMMMMLDYSPAFAQIVYRMYRRICKCTKSIKQRSIHIRC